MALLDEVKNYLDITWETTEEERQKLQGMIDRGKAALKGKIGECNFEEETPEKALLLSYVMYDRSGALSDFWQHYKGEITSLRLKNKVKEYDEKQTIPDF